VDQFVRFLLIFIMIGCFIIITGIVITELEHKIKKSRNQNYLFIPPLPPTSSSQYAFIEKSYCPRCGQSLSYENKLCPQCGKNLGNTKLITEVREE
jgi:transcription initiation factor IIE alpha subunit